MYRRDCLQLRCNGYDRRCFLSYADAGYDCDGVCLADADGDGVWTNRGQVLYYQRMQQTKTVLVPMLMQATIATESVLLMRTATACVTNSKSQVVRMHSVQLQ